MSAVATEVLTFDAANEGPDQELVDFMRAHYWVCTFANEEDRGDGFLYSPSRPIDVPNGQMFWRRPTYGDILNYYAWIERGLDTKDQSAYRRSGPEPLLCVCGHGEDSHHRRLLGSTLICRSTCLCTGFRKKVD